MDQWIKVILLGIVQGITELLPISSTGHLIVTAELIDFRHGMDETFTIFIQIGSVFAVLFYYRADLWRQFRTITHDKGVQRLWLGVVIASIPAALVGFTLRDFIQEVLYSPAVVGITLIVGGLIFIFIERSETVKNGSNGNSDVENVSLRQAFSVGLAQMIALIPGVSRSGASIIGGLVSGLNRPTAAAFSFYLAIPVLGGATMFDLVSNFDTLQGREFGYLIVGAVVSAIVSFLAIDWLLRFVSRNSFLVFGYYRIIAGLVILLLVGVEVLARPEWAG